MAKLKRFQPSEGHSYLGHFANADVICRGHNTKWIAGAIEHPGAFTAKAKAAGMGVQQFAAKVTAPGSQASTQTKRQANLAKTLTGFRRGK